MGHFHGVPKARQRGVIMVVAVLLLAFGVIFVLTQTIGSQSGRAIDTSRQLDSTAALMLAESGLQRAQSVIGSASAGNTISNGSCTGLVGGPYTLGRGSFSITAATSNPATCDNSGATACTSCSVTSVGTVGSVARSLQATIDVGQANGTTGYGTTVTMVLKNTFNVPAMSLFMLAVKRQDPGGNASVVHCSNGITGCTTMFNVESSNGNQSIGGMGVAVDIPALTNSKIVQQTISQARGYAEVGALFPSTSSTSTPTIAGAYWDDASNPASDGTYDNSNGSSSTGTVNSGVATSSGTCVAASDNHSSTSKQTCTNWCYGGDTLIFGISGRSSSVSGQITPTVGGVTFNTSGTPAQNIQMTRIVHFPNTDGSIVNASGKMFAETWYAYNPWYMLSLPATGLGATSYPMQLQGTIGGTVNVSNMSSGTTTMVVSSFTDSNAKLCIGDVLSRSDGGQDRFATNTRITQTPANPTGSVSGVQCTRQAGTYTFDQATTNNMNGGVQVSGSSNRLVVRYASATAYQTGTVTLNSPIQQSGTDVATPTSVLTTDTATYALSARLSPRATGMYTQGSSGATITMPSGSTAPSNGTIVAVYSGNGKLPAQATVTGSSGSTFTVSSAPTSGNEITNAAICGGTCAFFNNPSSTTGTTTFTVSRSAVTQWGGGFMCLSGVDSSRVQAIRSSTANSRTWKETIQ